LLCSASTESKDNKTRFLGCSQEKHTQACHFFSKDPAALFYSRCRYCTLYQWKSTFDDNCFQGGHIFKVLKAICEKTVVFATNTRLQPQILYVFNIKLRFLKLYEIFWATYPYIFYSF